MSCPGSDPSPSDKRDDAPAQFPFELEEAPVAHPTPIDPALRPPPPLRALDPRRSAPKATEPWTTGEGVRDTLRFLARRAPAGTIVWLALAAALAFVSDLGHVAGEVSFFTIMLAFFALVCGLGVGFIFGGGLNEAVRFTGWIPWSLTVAVSVAVIVVGTLVVHAIVPFPGAFFGVLVAVMSCVGAAAAVTKATWASS